MKKDKNKKRYIVYATGDQGNGYVQRIGEFDFLDEIEIRVGTFAKDVVITIDEENIDNETENGKGD